MAFLRHGSRVAALCPEGHPLRFVSGIEKAYDYSSLDSEGALKAAILDADPSLVIPGDDGVVWQLHAVHRSDEALRPLIEKSLGSRDFYASIQSRYAVLQAAASMGVCIPVTKAIGSEDQLADWDFSKSAVLKLDGTWGGTGVSIVSNRQAALSEFQRMSKSPGLSFALKRWLVNSDPLALWSWRQRKTPSITLQEFVAGRPANTMIACWQGEVLGIVTVEVLASQGATGAATVVRLVKNAEIERAAQLLAAKFQLSGFHGLDFMIASDTGVAYLIELNPRCTQLGHLRLAVQGDLAGALLAKVMNESSQVLEDPIEGNVVAFFPQTLNWNPRSIYIRQGYHDVPWEEPTLLRELLRSEWPERQWISRVYHYFRSPQKLAEEVRF